MKRRKMPKRLDEEFIRFCLQDSRKSLSHANHEYLLGVDVIKK